MKTPPFYPDMRGVHLESLIRKALADAWAKGVTFKDAESMVLQFVRGEFPNITKSEVCSLIDTLSHF